MKFYFLPSELLSYLDHKHPNLAMYIRHECKVITTEEVERLTEQTKLLSGRTISREQRYEVLKRQKWNCNQCGEKLKFSIQNKWEAEVAHIDHIHPYSKRYSYKNGVENINELPNLQALCPKCNKSKFDKIIH